MAVRGNEEIVITVGIVSGVIAGPVSSDNYSGEK